MRRRQPGVREALTAAALFGAATPFASRLAGDTPPAVLAGLLYLGSGMALSLSMLVWPLGHEARLVRRDMPWLAGAILFGGGLGPLLLVVGLHTTLAATASLLLNLEVVLTALVAWVFFHEGFNRRVGIGLSAILGGGIIASWQSRGGLSFSTGALAIAGACGCWAIDNNLTQRVSSADPRQIATLKGLIAGSANLAIGIAVGGSLPGWSKSIGAMTIGAFGYGLSLMLFVIALRHLGSARTGAYFGVAPFVGVIVAITIFGEPLMARMVPAGLLMAFGVWLHLSEHHDHQHQHEPLIHAHLHTHDDDQHAHEHSASVLANGAHSHEHRHESTIHRHTHRPDIHHRHAHQ